MGHTNPVAERYTDASIMPFGRFKGKALVNVPAYYFLWLKANGCTHKGINDYILQNSDALNKEVSKIKLK